MSKSENFLAAIISATSGAAVATALKAEVVQFAINSGRIAGAVPSMAFALAELLRVHATVSDIDRDTSATVRLVIASPASVRAAALTAANQMRQAAQAAVAGTGRLESTYQAGVADLVLGASLAHVVLAGNTMVYAATEAARQLEVIAGKIKV